MANGIRLAVTAVASPLEVGADEAPALLQSLQQAFAASGVEHLELVPAPGVVTDPTSAVAAGRCFYEQRVDAVCIVAASWFEDYLVLDLLEECSVPVIAWSRPGMETGSLCGMQQLIFMLKALGRPYLFLFEDVRCPAAVQRAREYASAAALYRQLRRARIGHLGHRVEGMTETTAHELALKKVFGPRVVGLDTQVFLERAASVKREPVAARWQEIKAQVGRVMVPDAAGVESLQVYEAMRAAVEELSLAAVAVGCYPHLMGKVCLAASLFSEEGVPIACEGDVNGALGMLILTRLTGQPVHNADLLDPIPAENAIVFSHCGCGGFSLAASRADVTLGLVRLMGHGLCCLFPARPGPVTLVNIVPTLGGYRLAALYGQAVETEMVFPGNPLRVRFEAGYRAILAWIAREGLGHHWMAAYGDLRQPLEDLAAMVGCEVVGESGASLSVGNTRKPREDEFA
jgi:L-fucose isomerase-like protein